MQTGHGKSPPRASYDAFLSYSRRDVDVARRLEEALEARELSVFRDESDIAPGEMWLLRLEQAIQGSRAILFLISPASVESGWVEEERVYGQIQARRDEDPPKLIPVLLGDAEPPGFLASRQALSLEDDGDLERVVEALAKAVGGRRETAPSTPTLVPELAFLTLFPEGLLDSVYQCLVARRGATKVARAAARQGVVRSIQSRGVRLTGLAPSHIASGFETIDDPVRSAAEVLTLLQECLEERDVFGHVMALGRGRVLLLRDLLALAELVEDGDEMQERRERIAERVRGFLPQVIDEGELRLGVEVTQRLRRVFPPTTGDQLLYASLLTRLGSAEQALNLYEIYRGGDYFDDAGLPPAQRLAAIQDWAKAAKAAGVARSMHRELIAGYEYALRLIEEKGEQDRDIQHRKADLLQNRATQLGVYGDPEEWVTAQADLDQACRLYESIGATDSLMATRANLVALALDRLPEGEPPPQHLLDELAKLEEAAADTPASHDLFFFLYQRAKLLRRLARTAEARDGYRQALRVAEQAGLEHRAAIARLWILRLERQDRKLSPAKFLEEVEGAVEVLERHPADRWATNALVRALLEDVAELYYDRSETERALDALTRAFRAAAAVRRRKADGGCTLARILSRVGTLEPYGALRERFLEEHGELLADLLGKPRWKLDWEAIEHWIASQQED